MSCSVRDFSIRDFICSTSAAVTLDYAVLTAGVVALGVFVASQTSEGVEARSDMIASDLRTDIPTLDTLAAATPPPPPASRPPILTDPPVVTPQEPLPDAVPDPEPAPDPELAPEDEDSPGTEESPEDEGRDEDPDDTPDAEGPGHANNGNGNGNGNNGNGNNGKGGSARTEVATVVLPTLRITPGWGERVDSGWLSAERLPVPLPARFRMEGDLNPRGQSADGRSMRSGDLTEGTLIEMDTPRCGTSNTVRMILDDGAGVLEFTVERSPWPPGRGNRPSGC